MHIQNAEVSGGFYGPNASELGGSLSGNDSGFEYDKKDVAFGAVFGAKRQVKND